MSQVPQDSGPFSRFFVRTGLIPKSQFDAAQRALELRNAADYWGGGATEGEAQVTLADAELFVARVANVAGPPGDE